jgi:6-phosphogluconolactonase (cycloisomerase 2 family)
MKLQERFVSYIVLVLELLLILTGCGGGGCPTTSLSTSSGSSGGGINAGGSVCGSGNSGGSGTGGGINGQCTGFAKPNHVLYSFDIPTSGSTHTSHILPFAISANGALTLMCGNASATIGELVVVKDKFLYAFDSNSATIAAFTITHGNSGALTPVAGSPFSIPDTFTGFPTQNFPHIEADPLGRFVFVTNFAGNKVDVFQVDQNTGALAVAPGSGVTSTNPIHLAVEPSGNFVYVPDSQTAAINIFRIDSLGNMTAQPPFFVPTGAFPGTDAPLFIQAHPNGKFLFTANRGSVAAYQIDSTTGALSYAPSSPFNTSSLQVAPFRTALDATAKFLYAADTGNNGIPGFAVDPNTAALTLINGSPFAGQSVFDLEPNPEGPQMYVQIGNSINVYTINPTTGALTPPTAQAQFFTASNLVIANVQ